jgi:hypothetical protein
MEFMNDHDEKLEFHTEFTRLRKFKKASFIHCFINHDKIRFKKIVALDDVNCLINEIIKCNKQGYEQGYYICNIPYQEIDGNVTLDKYSMVQINWCREDALLITKFQHAFLSNIFNNLNIYTLKQMQCTSLDDLNFLGLMKIVLKPSSYAELMKKSGEA